MRAYAAHADFIAPAQRAPEMWRFVAGLIIAFAAYLTLNQMFFQTLYGLITNSSNPQLIDDISAGRTPLAMYILLLSFAFMAAGVGLSARLMHRRSFLSLLGPLPILVRDFRAVSVIVVGVMAVIIFLPPWDMGAPFVPNLGFGYWLTLLLPSLIFVLIQVSAEEIVFRGYIQQQLAARFRSPVIWMVMPSVLFALGHYLPQDAGDNALMIAVWAGVFGILMADLTARSGSLGPAIAVHFWNNVSAMMLVSLPDNLSGIALYLAPFSMNDTEALAVWLPVDFAMMLVLWLAARLAIRR